jgi:hypothetical protein
MRKSVAADRGAGCRSLPIAVEDTRGIAFIATACFTHDASAQQFDRYTNLGTTSRTGRIVQKPRSIVGRPQMPWLTRDMIYNCVAHNAFAFLVLNVRLISTAG